MRAHDFCFGTGLRGDREAVRVMMSSQAVAFLLTQI